MRRQQFVEQRTQRQDEIEQRRHPNPILRGGAAATDQCQHPSRAPDDRGKQEGNLEVVQRTLNVLMHAAFLRDFGRSCCLGTHFAGPSGLSALSCRSRADWRPASAAIRRIIPASRSPARCDTRSGQWLVRTIGHCQFSSPCVPHPFLPAGRRASEPWCRQRAPPRASFREFLAPTRFPVSSTAPGFVLRLWKGALSPYPRLLLLVTEMLLQTTVLA